MLIFDYKSLCDKNKVHRKVHTRSTIKLKMNILHFTHMGNDESEDWNDQNCNDFFFASHRNFYLMLSLHTKHCILKCILSEYLETLLLAITDVTANLFNKCVIHVSSID